MQVPVVAGVGVGWQASLLLNLGQWDQALGGNSALAAALLDRLLHHCHVLTIQGDSYRLKDKCKAGVLASVRPNPTDAPRRAILGD